MYPSLSAFEAQIQRSGILYIFRYADNRSAGGTPASCDHFWRKRQHRRPPAWGFTYDEPWPAEVREFSQTYSTIPRDLSALLPW